MNSTSRMRARVCALAAILAYAGVATADHRIGYHTHGDSGTYLGAGITRVDVDEDAALGLFPDLEDTSFKAYLGYAASDALRLELGYVDFGEYQDTLAFPAAGPFQPGVLEADGFTMGAELGVPLAEDIALFAKGGLVFWDAYGIAGGFGLEEEGEDPFFGAGIRFRLAPNLEVTGSFERYQLDDVDIDVGSLGVSLRF